MSDNENTDPTSLPSIVVLQSGSHDTETYQASTNQVSANFATMNSDIVELDLNGAQVDEDKKTGFMFWHLKNGSMDFVSCSNDVINHRMEATNSESTDQGLKSLLADTSGNIQKHDVMQYKTTSHTENKATHDITFTNNKGKSTVARNLVSNNFQDSANWFLSSLMKSSEVLYSNEPNATIQNREEQDRSHCGLNEEEMKKEVESEDVKKESFKQGEEVYEHGMEDDKDISEEGVADFLQERQAAQPSEDKSQLEETFEDLPQTYDIVDDQSQTYEDIVDDQSQAYDIGDQDQLQPYDIVVDQSQAYDTVDQSQAYDIVGQSQAYDIIDDQSQVYDIVDDQSQAYDIIDDQPQAYDIVDQSLEELRPVNNQPQTANVMLQNGQVVTVQLLEVRLYN